MIPTKNIKCPNCGKEFSYFTVNNYIDCIDCKTRIPVEPMQEIPDEEPTEPIKG